MDVLLPTLKYHRTYAQAISLWRMSGMWYQIGVSRPTKFTSLTSILLDSSICRLVRSLQLLCSTAKSSRLPGSNILIHILGISTVSATCSRIGWKCVHDNPTRCPITDTPVNTYRTFASDVRVNHGLPAGIFNGSLAPNVDAYLLVGAAPLHVAHARS